MNKTDLIELIAKGASISKVKAETAINITLESMRKSLKRGEKVQLMGFGTFSVTKRAARTGRNPQTGKPIKIAARKEARIKPGKELIAAEK